MPQAGEDMAVIRVDQIELESCIDPRVVWERHSLLSPHGEALEDVRCIPRLNHTCRGRR